MKSRIGRPRVVYWNNIPAPYMRDRFNAVADRDNLDFEAWFSHRIYPDRHWAVDEAGWRFAHRYLPRVGVGARALVFPAPLLGTQLPDLVVSLYNEVPFIAGWWIARERGIRTAFWAEVTFDRWVRRRWWKERLKRAIFPRTDGIITIGRDGLEFARRYGASADRVHFVTNTIDVSHWTLGSQQARPRRDGIRRDLGLRGTVFLFVGRMWSGKGIDWLLTAYGRVQAYLPSTSLLMVGEGAERTHYEARAAGLALRGVRFTGFVPEHRLVELYTAADVFVFPSLGDPYGLVVDEAMAAHLPVIVSDACGEIRERIRNGRNGLVVPCEDVGALADAMISLARDPIARQGMADDAARSVAGHSHAVWAVEFEKAVERILASPPT